MELIESDCMRIKPEDQHTSSESLKSGEYPKSEKTTAIQEDSEIADSPESPDCTQISEIFVGEVHSAPSATSITSSEVVDYVSKATLDDSFFHQSTGTANKL